MGFVLVSAETMPAGLLPVIADGMGTSEGTVGQFISVWALGTVIVTVPAINLTRRFRRKPLVLVTIACLVVANTVTALSSDVAVSLASRFVAGAFTGIVWGVLAAYGRRISPADRGGLALSVVSMGAPVGFALGTPLGTWLGTTSDWRWSFGGLSVLALLILLLIARFVPDAAGQPAAAPGHLPLGRVFLMPGVAVVCLVIVVWMLAHNTIYTYIAPFLRATGTGLGPDLVLLVYGVASVVGVVITAAVIDRYPRTLLHLSVGLFVVAALVLLLWSNAPAAVLGATALWGVTFGGSSAQAAVGAEPLRAGELRRGELVPPGRVQPGDLRGGRGRCGAAGARRRPGARRADGRARRRGAPDHARRATHRVHRRRLSEAAPGGQCAAGRCTTSARLASTCSSRRSRSSCSAGVSVPAVAASSLRPQRLDPGVHRAARGRRLDEDRAPVAVAGAAADEARALQALHGPGHRGGVRPEHADQVGRALRPLVPEPASSRASWPGCRPTSRRSLRGEQPVEPGDADEGRRQGAGPGGLRAARCVVHVVSSACVVRGHHRLRARGSSLRAALPACRAPSPLLRDLRVSAVTRAVGMPARSYLFEQA